MIKINIETCDISKQKHVYLIRTTPKMNDWSIHKPMEAFRKNLNEWFVNVKMKTCLL